MRQETNADKGYTVVSNKISSFLTKLGYQKRGTVLWQDHGELQTLIELQKGQKSNKDCIYFTVNLSIVIKALLDPEIDNLDRTRGHEGHLYWRIGDFISPREDKWWKMDIHTDPASTAEDACLVLSHSVLPELQQYSSIGIVIDLLRSDKHPPMSEKIRKRLLEEMERL